MRTGVSVREYWIAAVPMRWNVVPNGRNAIEGATFDKSETTFTTVVYRRYTPKWEKAVPNQPGPAADNDGIPGPLLHARVGDRIVVHFKNLDNEFERPHSMHFHGVHYAFGSDGAYIPGFSTRGGNVKPGDEYTYRFEAEEDSRGVWPYHDHSKSMDDSIAGGMYGAISILGRDEKPPDHEFVVYFSQTLDFMTINGRAFVGNTPVFHAKVGDTVQWDVLAHRRTTTTRSTSTVIAGTFPAASRTREPSDRPRASRSGGRKTCPERGSTTATSRIT